MLSVESMRQHVIELCEQWDIVFHWHPDARKAWAIHAFEEISIPPIRSPITYATALHEIGHIRGHNQRSHKKMVRERGAWRWARANALLWTPAMERSCRDSLAWYERAIKTGKVPAISDPSPKVLSPDF
jgi:antirestriction protein ArdC